MDIIAKEILRRLPEAGESRRLFHGRGHCFAGFNDLVIDYYPPIVLVILYRERPQGWLKDLVDLLRSVLPAAPQGILLQERFRQGAPSRLLHGGLPDEVEAQEDGLRYRLRLGDAQNVGFFPDMAVGRRLLREKGKGKRILNLFAYSCSFSVAALAGGAEHVVNLDMNRGALELGRLNHRINNIDLRRTSFLPMELFRSFGRLRRCGPFDIIVCDPPASQGKSFTAERHWPKLIRRLPELLNPRGEVLACLSTPTMTITQLQQMFADLLPTARLVDRHASGEEFPEADNERGTSVLHYRLT